MTNRYAVLVVFLTLPLPASAAVHEMQPGETRWSGKIQPGTTLQVKGGVGDITVVTAPDDVFSVEVTRGTEGTVVPRIVIAESVTAVAVCTDYIAKAGAPSKCTIGPGRVRSAWSTKGYARADLKISVPRGVLVVADSVLGDIDVEPHGASVTVNGGNGNVSVTGDGPKVDVQTNRGLVEVTFLSEPMEQKAKVSVIEGGVRLVLPETRSIRYELYTHFAPIRSVYDLKGGPQDAKSGETKEERAYREIIADDYKGFLGPPKGPLLKLEVYVNQGPTSKIEIVAE